MAHHRVLRNDLLDCEIAGFLGDAIRSSLGARAAAARIVNDHFHDRASPQQLVAAAVELLREQAVEIERLSAEVDRVEVQLEGLRDGAVVP